MLIAEGDLLEGFTVRKIEKDEMQLVKGGCTLTLSLKGGEPKVTQPDGSLAPVAGAPAAATLRIKRLASVARLKRTLASRPATVMASAAMKRTLSASSSALASLDEGGRPQFLRPLNVGYVSSPFGWRVPPGRGSHRGYGASSDHKGTDIAAPQGSPVHVAADGVVVESTWSYAKGNFIEVRHAGGYSTCYYHMSKRIAQVGQRVEAGETIGAVGNTGISFGPHLHFEVHTNGIPVDPSNYVRSLRVR
jgi:murein DD-endopeptidase MepM/ murein hydrolase activator NlpD